MARTLLTIVTLAVLGTAPTLARPPYPEIFQEHYAENKALVAAAKEAKCYVCHAPAPPLAGGKPLNEFGLALRKHMPRTEFAKVNKPEQKAELAAKLKAALKATEADKNKAGDAYGDLLKAGKLPVPPPADREP